MLYVTLINLTLRQWWSSFGQKSSFTGKIKNQGLSGGIMGYKNHILSNICMYFENFCLFLQFSTLESCYIWFTIRWEYFSAFVYSNCPGKFKIRVCQGVSRGTKTPFWAIFAYFFEIFCLFLQFSTLESCYIWFTISLEYSSAYVYSCCPGKIQNHGLSGFIKGYKNTILSHFCLFLRFFVFFFSFLHCNHVIFGLQLV